MLLFLHLEPSCIFLLHAGRQHELTKDILFTHLWTVSGLCVYHHPIVDHNPASRPHLVFHAILDHLSSHLNHIFHYVQPDRA